MTELLTEDEPLLAPPPVEDYHARAGAVTPDRSHRTPRALALPPHVFLCDIAEFQPVVDASYPFPALSIRVSNGWRLDYNAQANWTFAKRSKKIKVLFGYSVFIPGQLDQVLSDIKSLFGVKCPDKVVLILDMESGKDFAGPGDHSAEANQWLQALVKYTGSRKKVIAYANAYDFASCWPDIPSWVKKITAAYSTTDPGTWGWQYAGGMDYPSPAGYPRTAPPFGTYVDFNVIQRSLAQVLADCGVSAPTPPHVDPHHPHPRPSYKTYRVRRGDSLSSIAKRFGVTWRQLVRWNKAKHPTLAHNPDTIHIGWVLRVSK